MMRTILTRTVLRLFTSLFWTPYTSKSKWRSVHGVVTDRKGNELPDAVVELENESEPLRLRLSEIGSVQSDVTGGDGRYYFKGHNADVDYTLRARYGEHWSKLHFLSKFDSTKRGDIRLVIPID